MSQSISEKLQDDQPSGEESVRNKSEAQDSPTYEAEPPVKEDDGEDDKKKEAKGSLRDYIVSRPHHPLQELNTDYRLNSASSNMQILSTGRCIASPF